MAKRITVSDYNHVKSRYIELNEIVESVEQIINKLGKQIQTELSSLKSLYDRNSSVNISVEREVDGAIRDLVIIDRMTPLYREAKSIKEKYNQSILNDLNTSVIVGSGLRWLFTSASNKTKAEEAYYRLSALLDGDYLKSVTTLQDKLSNTYNVTVEEAYKDIDSNKTKYAKTIYKLYPAAFGGDEPYLSYRFKWTEIKNLVKRYDDLVQKIRAITAHCSRAKDDIVTGTNTFISSNTLGSYIERELKTGEYNKDISNHTYGLIDKVYFYYNTRELADHVKELHSLYNNNYLNHVNYIRKGIHELAWIYAPYKTKKGFEESFDYLNQMCESDYVKSVYDALYDFKNIQYPQPDDVKIHFFTNKSSYRNILIELAPNAYYAGNTPAFVRSLFESLKKLQLLFSDGEQIKYQCKEDIKQSIQRYQYADLIKVLSEVPVDELNREKSGFKVKILKDAGFFTIADLYNTTVNRLAWIRGISWENANRIKAVTASIAARTSRTIGIRLSVDTQSPLASDLVRKIYSYLYKSELLKEAKELLDSKKDVLQEAENKLSNLGDGLEWLFLSDKEKDDFRKAYNCLSDFISGDYSNHLYQLHSAIHNSSEVSFSEAWDDFSENTIEYYNVLEEIYPGILGNDTGDFGLPEDLARQIAEEDIFPDGLLCTLRAYQTLGVKYILHQRKVLLGDEMGLGKTVQAIAAMVSLRNTNETHFLVVCPASVITNWCREIVKHSKLNVVKIHGQDKERAFSYWRRIGGVGVTTYETTKIMRYQYGLRFGMLVVDEAHYIKNRQAQRTQNVLSLCSRTDRVLFMTGTALENKVDEMISLIDVLNPEIASMIKSMAFMSTAPQFREKIAPVYFRRKREDVLKELPDLTEIQEWCSMTSVEEKVYEGAVLSKNYSNVRRVSWNVPNLKFSSKAIRLKELVEEADSENRKIIVFSYFLDTIQKVKTMFPGCSYGPITGSVTPARRQEILDEFDKAPSGSVLVAQIQSGGTGLNIQTASVVIICEPQFKPSIENQAISRAYRMGQARNVLVFRLLCENSVDEKISDVLQYKQSLFDAFADESVAGKESIELDQIGFKEIIQEEIDRINAKYKKKGKIDL